MDIKKLATEKRNVNSMNIDEFSALEIAKLMNEESKNVQRGVEEGIGEIAQVITYASEVIRNKGRVIYMGAGTSGRLALLDAVECPPTFGVDYDVIIGLIAGGKDAFVKAQEGAEDSEEFGVNDLKNINLTENDFVVGVAASGRTPYVIGGINYAKSIGCKTASIALTKNSIIGSISDIAVDVEVGSEVVTGSTRLKAGTAQKEILNMISTGAMILNGKVYQNLMVDVKQSNKKLVQRAINIVVEATDCEESVAIDKLALANGNAKTAIVMILLGVEQNIASEMLNNNQGKVKEVLKNK